MSEEIRQSIRLVRHTTNILRTEAEPLWPELEGNITGLINKIIADWSRNRNEKGGKTTQTNARLDRHERILQCICDKLDIDLETINGDDADQWNSPDV